MKEKFLVFVMMIISLSLVFAHGDIGLEENILNDVSINDVSITIKEIDKENLKILGENESKYYILDINPMIMMYGNLPIDINKNISVKGIIITNFENVKELLVVYLELDNKVYSIPEYMIDMMIDDGMIGNMGGYGYPGMMNMMRGNPYYGMMGGYGYPGMVDDDYYNMMDSPYNYSPNSKQQDKNEMNMENK
ncbi:hypothetical protein JCM30566_13500 [Marinitoga arctica]